MDTTVKDLENGMKSGLAYSAEKLKNLKGVLSEKDKYIRELEDTIASNASKK